MRSRSGRPRSFCPINLSLEVFGDSWTLLVLRDVIFGGKRHFRELLQSQEKIASNVLADRLKTLVASGILVKEDDPTHAQKAIYSLTEAGIDLLPVLAQIGAWGQRHRRDSERQDEATRAFLRELHAGGPRHWKSLMERLRKDHLGAAARRPRA